MQLIFQLLYLIYVPFLLATVVPDDDGIRGHVNEEGPSRSQTPPTPHDSFLEIRRHPSSFVKPCSAG